VNDGKNTSNDLAKNYTDYLDKEMTIMGILSTFSVIAFGGCLTALSSVTKDHSEWFQYFWHDEGPFVVLGMIGILFSAFFFYRQRSILAYYVGQIHLGLFDSNLVNGSTKNLLRQADRWSAWTFYRQAFLCLFAAAVFFGRVGLSQVISSESKFSFWLVCLRQWELWIPFLLCVLFCIYTYLAFNAYPDDDAVPYFKFMLHPKRLEKDLAGDNP
jgi:hypothetical protein